MAARSVKDIFDEMVAEKEKYPSLAPLTNNRDTSVWRNLFMVVAKTINAVETSLEAKVNDLTEVGKSRPVGTNKWYADEFKKFQLGYDLVYDTSLGRWAYRTLDESAQIIKSCSVTAEGRRLLIKTAKMNSDGDALVGLDNDEKTAFLAFVSKVILVGTGVQSRVTADGDLLRLTINIKVNPNIINSSGQSVSNTSEYPCEDAIKKCLLDHGLDNFDSVFSLNMIENALLSLDGVQTVNITAATATPQAAGYPTTDIKANALGEYTSFAGYLVIEDSVDYSLHSNLNYY